MDTLHETVAEELALSLGDFGFALHRRLPTRSNLVYSPFSVWLTLVALVPGAQGLTLKELLAALAGDGGRPAEKLTAAAGSLARSLSRRTGTTRDEDPATGEWRERPTDLFVLDIATALWVAERYPFHEAYIRSLMEDVSAELASLDFGDAEAAASRINAWVNERTRGRIPSVVRPPSLHPLMRLILTNATYFKAAWLTPFERDATAPAPFHTPEGLVEADMMRDTGERGHIRMDDLGLEAVALPYEAMGAILIVPDRGGLERVEAALSMELIQRISGGLREKTVTLHLPRFDIGSILALEEPLLDMGVRDAFKPTADFSGITPHPEGLSVSSVIHQARIKVDEEGTEAAAATLAMEAGSALPEEEPERVILVVDRPFFFLVRDHDTQAILFTARVTDPTA
jgi:serpin B